MMKTPDEVIVKVMERIIGKYPLPPILAPFIAKPLLLEGVKQSVSMLTEEEKWAILVYVYRELEPIVEQYINYWMRVRLGVASKDKRFDKVAQRVKELGWMVE